MRRPLLLANGRPAAWETLPADTAYGCESKQVGRVVPGKRGGVISSCATPSKEKPRKGQFYLGLPGAGKTVPKAWASRLLRDQDKPREREDRYDVEQLVELAEQERHHVPGPTGLELPHIVGSSKCSPSHKLWGDDYRDAIEDARERAAQEVDPEDSEGYQARVAELFAGHPRAAEWSKAEGACVTGFRKRHRKVKGESAARERARHRQSAIDRGEDVTGAEYLDSRLGSYVAKGRKRNGWREAFFTGPMTRKEERAAGLSRSRNAKGPTGALFPELLQKDQRQVSLIPAERARQLEAWERATAAPRASEPTTVLLLEEAPRAKRKASPATSQVMLLETSPSGRTRSQEQAHAMTAHRERKQTKMFCNGCRRRNGCACSKPRRRRRNGKGTTERTVVKSTVEKTVRRKNPAIRWQSLATASLGAALGYISDALTWRTVPEGRGLRTTERLPNGQDAPALYGMLGRNALRVTGSIFGLVMFPGALSQGWAGASGYAALLDLDAWSRGLTNAQIRQRF